MASRTGAGTRESAQAVVQRMGEAATALLAALTPEQQAKLCFGFAQEAQRTFWHYTPIARGGLPLGAMDRRQQHLAHQWLATGLSPSGFTLASAIMGLELALDAREGWSRPLPGRDTRLYYLRLFGRPHDHAPWGWSFEGRHLSLNYTLVDGRIVAPTPSFFGANPAEAPLGNVARLRPLQGVEDLARELVHALDEGQRQAAVIAAVAPPDLVLTNRPHAVEGALLADAAALEEWRAEQAVTGHSVTDDEVAALRYSATPCGICAQALTPGQAELLHALVAEYLGRMPDALAEAEKAKLAQASTPLYFAWAGGLRRGEGHYYRIQGSSFVAEYDNTQNDANHIHSVWRDPHDDFGARLLARHYARHHEPSAADPARPLRE